MAQPRGHRGAKSQVAVYVEKTRVGAINWSYVRRSGIEWGRSGRIHVVFLNRCPSRYLLREGVRGALGPQPGRLGHPQLRPEDQHRLVRQPAPQHPLLTYAAARRKTACHELGHTFGLEHRRTGRTCMRDGFTTMYGHPDGTDYANLRRIYARP
jgi:hypothetical protein